MSLHRGLRAALWLSALVGACAASTAWAGSPYAHASKLHPWVLIALFWGVALASIAVHYIARHLVHAAIVLKRSALALATWCLLAAGRAPALAARLAEAGASSLAALLATLHLAAARRAPGALRGWSRTAIKALRA